MPSVSSKKLEEAIIKTLEKAVVPVGIEGWTDEVYSLHIKKSALPAMVKDIVGEYENSILRG